MADPISALLALFSSSAIPAATAPSILGGGMTGAGMMTAGSPIIPGLLTSSTPSMLGSLGAMGSAGLQYAKDNPFGDLTTRDKLGLGLQGINMLNQPQPQMQAPQLGLIRPQPTGQYQPTLQARIPQTMYPRRLV